MKNGFLTSEFWIALLGPIILQAVNGALGTALTQEQLTTGGWAMVAYIIGRSVLKWAATKGIS